MPLEIIGCWMPHKLVSLVSIMVVTSPETEPEKAKQEQGHISKPPAFGYAILMDD